MIMDNGQITGYQTQGGEPKIEPRLSDESVWLTADLMAELFKWQYMGCTRIALIYPLFPLKLAD
jgi:hypothetical protein